jgi:hypothetical protein
MSKWKIHVNCSFWEEDGKLLFYKEPDYRVLEAPIGCGDDIKKIELHFNLYRDFGGTLYSSNVEGGINVWSFHIQRPEDPDPIFPPLDAL